MVRVDDNRIEGNDLFDLLEQASSEYTKSSENVENVEHVEDFDINDQYETSSDTDIDQFAPDIKCLHEHISENNDVYECIDCGEQIKIDMSLEKSGSYPSGKKDMGRHQIHKVKLKGIYDELRELNFPDPIAKSTNEIYMYVSKKSNERQKAITSDPTGLKKDPVFRRFTRRSIILACVSWAYRNQKKYKIPSIDHLINIFQVKRRKVYSGLKFVNQFLCKTENKPKIYYTPLHSVSDILDKFSGSACYPDIEAMYNKIKDLPSDLNRSRPQSIAAGLVYYYIQQTKKDIPISLFSKKVELSELTITKISKKIASILEAV